MIERIANMVLYGTVGYLLSDAGLTVFSWHFWAVMACVLAIQLVHPVMELLE